MHWLPITEGWRVGENDDEPWLAVDLGAIFEINSVATQGIAYNQLILDVTSFLGCNIPTVTYCI